VSKARAKSILLAKGSLFSPTGEPSQWMRFNAAYGTAPELVHYLSQSLKAAA
jgi:DNA-binding transcriptional MocR family regulator